jgi:hypothetical protein
VPRVSKPVAKVSKLAARVPKPENRLLKQMETLGLSAEDLARIFRVSERSARAWTIGGTRIPTWLVPALEIYALLPPAARHAAMGSPALDGVNAGSARPTAPTQPRANTNRHPFARIEEL